MSLRLSPQPRESLILTLLAIPLSRVLASTATLSWTLGHPTLVLHILGSLSSPLWLRRVTPSHLRILVGLAQTMESISSLWLHSTLSQASTSKWSHRQQRTHCLV